MVKAPVPNDNIINSTVDRLFYSTEGHIVVSALFGLALALVFRRVCKDNCTEYYAPFIKDIENKKFKIEDTCYEYKPYSVKCDTSQKIYTSYNINTKPDNKVDEPGLIDKFFK
jgi:hypothetical protein